jgi:hypothetical protein
MSLIKVVVTDLAKLFFSIHSTDEHDKCKFRKTFKRNKRLAKIPKCPPELLVWKPAWVHITGQENLPRSLMTCVS